MGLIRPSVLFFALLMTAPALYRFAIDELDITEVLTRYLIAVPIAAVLMAAFRFVTSGYGNHESPAAVPTNPTSVDTESGSPKA
jgi:hypothetical protein